MTNQEVVDETVEALREGGIVKEGGEALVGIMLATQMVTGMGKEFEPLECLRIMAMSVVLADMYPDYAKTGTRIGAAYLAGYKASSQYAQFLAGEQAKAEASS